MQRDEARYVMADVEANAIAARKAWGKIVADIATICATLTEMTDSEHAAASDGNIIRTSAIRTEEAEEPCAACAREKYGCETSDCRIAAGKIWRFV